MKNIIEIRNLSKRFKDILAVNNVSFSVTQGDLFAFLGTNGAGKSTTINMICTLLSKTSGSIVVGGFDIDKSAQEIRSRLGVVFQENVLDELLSVGDNLTIRGHFQGLEGKRLAARLSELKGLLDLAEIWKRPYGKLSGGQKRKCEIARALLGTPQLLILDEPTTGLDPQTRVNIWAIIRDLKIKQGMTVFLTTHYMEETAGADQVVILEKGVICAQGTPDTLKSRFGRDTLKLRFNDMEYGKRKLAGLGYTPTHNADVLAVHVGNSHEALSILGQLGDFLDFELIKGSMDDVFLTVTEQSEVLLQ